MQTLTLADDEIAAWLRLVSARGVGPVAVRHLLSVYGLPHAIFEQSPAALAQVVGAKLAGAIKRADPDGLAERVARVLKWAAIAGNHFVTLADPAYPRTLLEIADPPVLLYVKGRLELLHAPALAIVGSRNGTAQGLANTQQFAHALAHAGLTIVSGLALGIDGAAHRGALGSPSSTIAVMGTGADLVYPARHYALAHEIAAHGAIVSEWPLGTTARAQHFPQRNRLIAGLTQGVLVAEAATQSGSLITARLAGEMGREVFAIPGSIHSPLTKGCHQLIKEGAKLVECVQDILDEIPHKGLPGSIVNSANHTDSAQPEQNSELAKTTPKTRQPQSVPHTPTAHAMIDTLDSHARCVLAALDYDPTPLESLATRTQLNSAILQAALLQLELGGWIAALPGGRVERIKHDAVSP